MRPRPPLWFWRPLLVLGCAALAAMALFAQSSQRASQPTSSQASQGTSSRPASTTQRPAASAPTASLPLIAAARKQIGTTIHYDPAYVVLAYPNGDVPLARGVCTDVVIRAFRGQGLDLQKAVHEDMRGNFARYPQKWGLRGPDRNIDHRRVPNLQTWFERQGWKVSPTGGRASDFKPGDLVTWMLPGNLPHIGIVGDRKSPLGTPLIIHNIGRGAREDDILFGYRITGHYREKL